MTKDTQIDILAQALRQITHMDNPFPLFGEDEGIFSRPQRASMIARKALRQTNRDNDAFQRQLQQFWNEASGQ